MARSLEGVRVLVVEDDFLVSLLLDDLLTAAGCKVLGPVARLAEALDAAAKERFDAAVLDINLAGEQVYPVADVLAGRRLPFVFVSGYGDAIPHEYADHPKLGKPFTKEQLRRALAAVMPAASDG
jgi:CheY-like chemotaxis protein